MHVGYWPAFEDLPIAMSELRVQPKDDELRI